MIIFFIQKFEWKFDISKWMGFCINAVFTEKYMTHMLVMSLLSG